MKRAYSPKEIAKKTYKTLPWGGRWEESFGLPEENSTWSSAARLPAARVLS